ncbi:ABC-type transport system involved in multi-copper enzyme maturation permease subunit [Kibdelosporangium banguiense]|uniref:ABC-type transport system involved in multi-copper enzyme maturation permease subunit n=1 Tax=Kibdelosporangium banguiense TaxID=1365924 RepID=A0ABS4TMK3_9PSEU|nr:ABC transporter permease [Kibdelosporangium banguiense]MBP2325632.1 ABC-type transport system involved in multi-copper enzyme maturation permease subunit [Kibdelosporangium banguiense]
MIWVSWRRQRAQLITLLGMLVVGAGVITLLRSNMIDAINSSQLARCVTLPLQECAAPEAAKAFQEQWSNPLDIARAMIIGVPALIGVFIGAPLFARELEQGTHVLAFTQSVSRTRWMLSKLAIALAPALILLITLQYLVSSWLTAAGTLGPLKNSAFTALNFGIQHASPVGYTLFAFALGTFIGVVSRRTLVAMTAGLGAFVVMRFALSGLVDNLVPAQRVELAPDKQLTVYQDGSLVLEKGWLDAAGQPVPGERVAGLLQNCKSTGTQEAFLACLPKSGLARQYASFIPESQAWQVHLVDAAIFGGLAILLLVGTAWVLRRQS